MVRIAGVVGAITPPGRLSAAVSGALQAAVRDGHDVDLVELGCLRLDFADGRPAAEHSDDSARVLDVLAAADGVILASPVYRASLTGALKNLLDLLPVETLQGKPVAIVAMGTTAHHFLGVESHLRDILAWFGALALPTSVYLQSSDFDEGRLSAGPRTKLQQLASTLALLAATNGEALGPVPLAAERRG